MGLFTNFLGIVSGIVKTFSEVKSMSATVERQREHIAALTDRVTRLEASLDMLLRIVAPRRLE